MKTPEIVSPEDRQVARQKLMVKEKELTHARDAMAAERRRMPWQAVELDYEFDGPGGKASLLDLFDGRRQLIIYRAFFEPGVHGWPDHACVGCSMVADHVGNLAHLNARDRKAVRKWEEQFLAFMHEQKADVRNLLAKEKKLTDALAAAPADPLSAIRRSPQAASERPRALVPRESLSQADGHIFDLPPAQ